MDIKSSLIGFVPISKLIENFVLSCARKALQISALIYLWVYNIKLSDNN